MNLFYWDVNLVFTDTAGNRYPHQVRVRAGTMQTAKAAAVMQCERPGYTVVAKEAYRGGAVHEVVK